MPYEIDDSRDGRMHVRREVDFFCLLLSTLDDLDIADEGFASIGVQLPCPVIANPAMDTTSTRVNPEEVLEAKVFPENLVNDLDRNGHPVPAFVADIAAAADYDSGSK